MAAAAAAAPAPPLAPLLRPAAWRPPSLAAAVRPPSAAPPPAAALAAGASAACGRAAAALLPVLALGGLLARRRGGRGAAGRVALAADFKLHARDPMGVKHVETRKQAREASIIKTTLMSIFDRCEIQYRRVGDDEIQRRIRIDDVIMSKGCASAYVHVGSTGDALEKRQAIVWLVRNKGAVKTALAKRFKRRGRLPQVYFVESRFDEWGENIQKARKHPELNYPDPFEYLREKEFKSKVWRKLGVGNASAPPSKWGYRDPG